MSARTICSVPLDWTLADYERHTCGDGSYVHLSHSEVANHQKRNVVTFLRESTTRREHSVVQIQILAVRDDRWAGRPLSSYVTPGERMNAGLSFRVGEHLAKRIRQRHGWALVMFAEIRRRPIDESAWGESEKDGGAALALLRAGGP